MKKKAAFTFDETAEWRFDFISSINLRWQQLGVGIKNKIYRP